MSDPALRWEADERDGGRHVRGISGDRHVANVGFSGFPCVRPNWWWAVHPCLPGDELGHAQTAERARLAAEAAWLRRCAAEQEGTRR